MENFPIIPKNRSNDIHGLSILKKADLILFVAGNQFMVMDDLIKAFKSKYPEVKNIFYETLPPGLELKQILSGGAWFQGHLLPGIPDIYVSVNEEAMKKLIQRGLIEEDYFVYLHNRIVLMVKKGNPLNIKSIFDLAKDEIRISQPNPEIEDIGVHIVNMYKEAGGEELVYRIMEEKRAEGTTIYTVVHHRETPLRFKKGTVDVGPVWATEVPVAQKQGIEVEMVEVGEELDQRDKVNYYIASFKKSPNIDNAKKFLDFIKSEVAQKIYKKYGFIPHFVNYSNLMDGASKGV